MPSISGESEVRSLYAELLEAWNRHSADDVAARFADDSLLVAADGSRVPGSSLPGHLRLVFVDRPATHYVGHVLGVRPLGDGAVLLHALAGIVPAGGARINPAVNTIHTLIAEKGSGGWRIVLFQNAPAAYHNQPGMADQHTMRLQQIVDTERRRTRVRRRRGSPRPAR